MGYSQTAGNRFEKPVPGLSTETEKPPKAVVDILIPKSENAGGLSGNTKPTTVVGGSAAETWLSLEAYEGAPVGPEASVIAPTWTVDPRVSTRLQEPTQKPWWSLERGQTSAMPVTL